MYERILVPLDGSKAAEFAIPYAVEISSSLGSEFHSIRVFEPALGDTVPSCQAYLDLIAEQVNLQFKDRGVVPSIIRSTVLTGRSATEILRYVDDNDISLIIMSRHGASDEEPWFLGSIADKVLRATKRSVLLAKAPAGDTALQRKQLLKRILVPLDGSRVGAAAIPSAEVLAQAFDAELVLFRVVVPSSLQRDSFRGFITPSLEELVTQAEKGEENRKDSAIKYLKEVENPLKEQLLTASAVVLGSPPDEIVDYAKENGIDLIAMSSHGRTGVGRWIFGSVTDKVLHAGDTPVLVVRARKT